jgi:hypothetical protein
MPVVVIGLVSSDSLGIASVDMGDASALNKEHHYTVIHKDNQCVPPRQSVRIYSVKIVMEVRLELSLDALKRLGVVDVYCILIE